MRRNKFFFIDIYLNIIYLEESSNVNYLLISKYACRKAALALKSPKKLIEIKN